MTFNKLYDDIKNFETVYNPKTYVMAFPDGAYAEDVYYHILDQSKLKCNKYFFIEEVTDTMIKYSLKTANFRSCHSFIEIDKDQFDNTGHIKVCVRVCIRCTSEIPYFYTIKTFIFQNDKLIDTYGEVLSPRLNIKCDMIVYQTIHPFLKYIKRL